MSESYIVHIYRREDDGTVIGMVERVGDCRRRAFRSYQELWALLERRPAPGRGRPPVCPAAQGKNDPRNVE